VPVALGHIVQFVLGATETAGCDGMKQRFPDVRTAAIDQRNLCLLVAAEAVAKFCRQFKPGGATTYDDNMVRRAIDHLTDSAV
jgi:imidazolonepropionase-like amidohydrolase